VNAPLIRRPFDVEAVRAQFPILAREVQGRPLVYLDNAASAQKPEAVIEAMAAQMRGAYANVHRGLHTLANETTEAFEAARATVARFINAPSPDSIVFTKGGTHAINIVAAGLDVKPGDEIVLSVMEHHSNIVPWHFLRERKGAVLRWLDIEEDGAIDLLTLDEAIGPRTKLVATSGRARRRLRTLRTPRASLCCSTAAKRRCTALSTCKRSRPISMSSPATSSTGRQGSACCTASASCLRRCHRWKAAAR
jgi:cysteine desulfurase/selenocysteine lyase